MKQETSHLISTNLRSRGCQLRLPTLGRALGGSAEPEVTSVGIKKIRGTHLTTGNTLKNALKAMCMPRHMVDKKLQKMKCGFLGAVPSRILYCEAITLPGCLACYAHSSTSLGLCCTSFTPIWLRRQSFHALYLLHPALHKALKS